MKKLKTMTKKELLDIYEKFDITLPEIDKPTNPELVDDLETIYGLTDEKLEEFEKKKDTELTEEKQGDYSQFAENDEGQVVICMDRQNASFGIGSYTFSRERRYVPVDAETAATLLALPGFHKVTREELKRVNFKK